VQRLVTAELDLELGSSVDLIFQIAAAQPAPHTCVDAGATAPGGTVSGLAGT
jgi:hypothetical protein